MAELVDTNSATAKASDILQGKTAYVKSGLVAGTIPTQAGSTVVPGTSVKTVVDRGKYIGSDIVMAGDVNLKPENIAKGVTIFDVKGTWEGEPPPPTLPDGFYEIDVKSDSNVDELISGGGVASKGVVATVSAKDDWYATFKNWEEKGEVVSESRDYTFTVDSDKALIATYDALPFYTISTTVFPEKSGIVLGAGKYYETDTATLTAFPESNYYKFLAWKEDGGIVSQNNPYAFTIEKDRELTAEFTRSLPDGYIPLEYIYIDGNSAYLSTGVTPSASKTIKMDIEPLSDGIILYSRYVQYVNRIYVLEVRFSSSSGIYAAMGLHTAAAGVSPTIYYTTVDSNATSGRMVLTVVPGLCAVKVNDNPSVKVVSNNSFSSSMSAIAIPNTGNYSVRMKIYSCQITSSDGDRSFVPCINPDGVVGMYDIVNSKFYGSGNSNQFVAGPIVNGEG